MNKKRLILLILIIGGVWYFWGRSQKVNGPPQPAQVPAGQELPSGEEAKVEEAGSGAEHNAPQPPLTLSGGDVGEGQARVHYFTKEALASCSVETVAQELAVDPKYGHRAAGALVEMTLPFSTEQAGQYVSALAPGTRLLTVQIDKEGTAQANYNSALNAEATGCVKAQRRAQIEATLKEFSEVKKIVITVQGEPWE